MWLAEARWFWGMYVARIRRGRRSTDAICSVGFLLAAAEALSPWHSALALLVLSFHDSVDAPEVMRR